MLRGIIGFEWRYQTRQATFLLAVAVFFWLGGVFVATGYGPDNLAVNSAYGVAQSLGLLSLVSLFVLSLFCANTVQRDAEHRMAELVFTTSVSKRDYLVGRFAGALLAALAVLAAGMVGLMVAPWVVSVDVARLDGLHVERYLWAFAVLGVPNVVLAASLLFAVSALFRSTLACYVGGVFVYGLYFVGSLWGDSPLMAGSAPQRPEALARAALLDPFGLSAFFEQTRYWTDDERATRLLVPGGHLLWNRLLWLGVAVAVLGVVSWRFSFRAPARAGRGAGEAREDAAPVAVVAARVEPGTPGLAAFASALRQELGFLSRSRPLLALLVLWGFIAGMEVAAAASGGEYGTRRVLSLALLLDCLRQPLSLVGSLTVIYFSAELVWRERAARFDALVDATPAPALVFYLAKAVALVTLVGVLAGVAAAVGLLYPLVTGSSRPEPALLGALLWLGGLPLALFAVAALLMQTLSPHRYVGMVASLLLCGLILRGDALGLAHPLLRYAGAPPVRHTDLNGFGPMAASFSAFMGYWGAFAALLAFVTVGLWRRGVPSGLWRRARALPGHWGRPGLYGAGASALAFLAVGCAVFHDSNRVNVYETREEALAWRADYERAFKVHESLAQPSIVGVRTSVDLFPREARYRVAGTYRLENRASTPVDTVWVAVPRGQGSATVSLRGAALMEHDGRFGMYRFQLERPLLPGGEAELAFEVVRQQRGVRAADFDLSVVENGSFLLFQDAFPSIGYRHAYELRDPVERRARGLPATPRMPALDESGEGRQRPPPAAVTFEATVSTDEDQVALTSGTLRRQWREGGRGYFHYVMARPMVPVFAFASARYAVERVSHRGVEVEVYFHPAHAANVKRILDAATRTLDELGTRYGPYPHAELRIAEIPSYWGFGALATPNLVFFVEDRGFLTEPSGEDVDLVLRRTAHEVAHQWWGHQLVAAEVEGATMLVESLTKYAEQRVLAREHGERALDVVLEFERDRYLSDRTSAREVEPALYKVTNQSYLSYRKGALVMNALRDLVGEDTLDAALRRLLRTHAPARGATSLDLLDALHAQAPARHHALIDQWLKDVVLYALAVESATVTAREDGRFEVKARVRGAKHARRGGVDVPLAMDERLDVAVYAGAPSSGASPLAVGKVAVRDGPAEVTLVVDTRPTHVSLDPFLLRIERERGDNVLALPAPASTDPGGR